MILFKDLDLDQINSNLTVFRTDKNEYLVRLIIMADGQSAGHPAYLLFHHGQDPQIMQGVDERKIASHRWDRASISQLFYFKPWQKSSLTGF